MLLVLLALLFAVPAGAAGPIIGRASVIDGDTIEIAGQRIRLHGIDAPESAQQCRDGEGRTYPCGRLAAQMLDRLLANSRPTRCMQQDRDRYGRIVATCFRADGKDAGALMVRGGHALDWPRYSEGVYAADQKAAEAARLGMWEGTFTPPWDWRQGQRDTAPAAAPRAGSAAPVAEPRSGTADCRIKGNINAKGDRIYHVPGSRHYERTRIDTRRGERWFCSEAEARQAGWRAPYR